MNAAHATRNALISAQQEQAYWAGRIEVELKFADGLIDLHPEQAAAWGELLGQARAVLGAERDLAHACGQIETILAPLAKTAKGYSIVAAGHAHIDMNWQWSWPETVHVTNDSFSTVLALMEDYPDFHFSQSQASIYQIIERYHPEMLPRIAERVREGRWEVTASHWVD
jgi:alpha-mannosidase